MSPKLASPPLVAFENTDVSEDDIRYLVTALNTTSGPTIGIDPCQVEEQLCRAFDARYSMATSSGSSALLAAAMLLRERGAGPGAEVIVPSFAFPTTAATFASVGFRIVFVDIEFPSLYVDPAAVAAAVTDKTCAVVTLPYNGVVGDVDLLAHVAAEHELMVIEDAAQAFGASWNGRAVGTLGDIGCISFDRAKAIVGGQAGALLCSDQDVEQGLREVVEYGTNRTAFMRGRVDRYGWTSLGSNLTASGIDAALLAAQLSRSEDIVARRRAVFAQYESGLSELARDRGWVIHRAPNGGVGGVNLFALLLADCGQSRPFIAFMKTRGIDVRDHFQPLHSSPAGLKYGRVAGDLPMTAQAVGRLVRLPFHTHLDDESVAAVVAAVADFGR